MKVVLALALAIFAASAGCGGEEPSGGRVKITFATVASPDTPDYLVLQNALLAFAAKNPGIIVNLTGDRLGTSYLIRDIIAEKSADVIDVRAEEVRQLAEREIFSPVTADCHDLAEVIVAPAWQLGELNKELFAVPWAAQPKLLLYNKSMLKEAGIENPPATWQELITAAEKITSLNKEKYGFALAGESSADFGRQYAMFLSQLRTPLIRRDEDRVRFNMTTEQSYAVMSFLLELQKRAPPEAIVTNDSDALKQFNSGRAAMVIAGPGCIGTDGPAGSEVGVAPMPAPEYGESRTDASFRYVAIPGYLSGRKREAAIKLVNFLATDGQKILLKGRDGRIPFMPVRRPELNDDADMKDPMVRAYANAIERPTLPAPAIVLEGKCSKDWIGYLHMALTGRKSKQSALESARDKGDQALSCIATDIGHPSASMVAGMAVVATALFFIVAYSVSRK